MFNVEGKEFHMITILQIIQRLPVHNHQKPSRKITSFEVFRRILHKPRYIWRRLSPKIFKDFRTQPDDVRTLLRAFANFSGTGLPKITRRCLTHTYVYILFTISFQWALLRARVTISQYGPRAIDALFKGRKETMGTRLTDVFA